MSDHWGNEDVEPLLLPLSCVSLDPDLLVFTGFYRSPDRRASHLRGFGIELVEPAASQELSRIIHIQGQNPKRVHV